MDANDGGGAAAAPPSALSTAHDSQYMASISAMGLDRLNAEPNRLREEAKAIEADVARLSLENYRIFIENHDCVRALRVQSKAIGEATDELSTELAGFRDSAGSFKDDAEDVIAAHRRNRQTLGQHMQVGGETRARWGGAVVVGG